MAALSATAGGPLTEVGASPATAPLAAVGASLAMAGAAVANVAMYTCLQQSTLIVLAIVVAIAPATMA
jgi:hypothetical protein